MNIREERNADFLVLCLEGRLDANNSKIFEEKVLAVIDQGETRFVIDLSQLDYISSAGLRTFLVASKRLTAAGGKMAFCSVQESVKQVFDILGFYSIFSILGSKDEALNSLR
jgi:stage II sporulation protein AA (anti-sigma F factor antagonist)